MNYKIFTEHPDAAWTRKWNDFLADALFPTHYTTPNFFIDPFVRGGQRFAVAALENNEIKSVVTGVDTGKRIVCGLFVRPQTAFGKGANRLEASRSLMEGLYEKGGADLEVVELFSWDPIPEFEKFGFNSREFGAEMGTSVLDLKKSAGELFKDFSESRRNGINKALRQNRLQITEIKNEVELAELYEIHKNWCQRKGNQPDTFEQMKLGFAQTNYRKIFIAKHEEKVIAGSYFRFCKGGILEYAGNNSYVEYQKLKPNELIMWRAIEWACEQDFQFFSLGGSHPFLRRFGGDIASTYRYKSDLTRLKIHHLKELVADFSIKTYKNLPQPVRTKIKAVLGRS